MLDKEKIIKWSDMDLSHLDLSTTGFMCRQYENTLFAVDPVINSRVALW